MAKLYRAKEIKEILILTGSRYDYLKLRFGLTAYACGKGRKVTYTLQQVHCFAIANEMVRMGFTALDIRPILSGDIYRKKHMVEKKFQYGYVNIKIFQLIKSVNHSIENFNG
jgi:hypothetical protein